MHGVLGTLLACLTSGGMLFVFISKVSQNPLGFADDEGGVCAYKDRGFGSCDACRRSLFGARRKPYVAPK